MFNRLLINLTNLLTKKNKSNESMKLNLIFKKKLLFFLFKKKITFKITSPYLYPSVTQLTCYSCLGPEPRESCHSDITQVSRHFTSLLYASSTLERISQKKKLDRNSEWRRVAGWPKKRGELQSLERNPTETRTAS